MACVITHLQHGTNFIPYVESPSHGAGHPSLSVEVFNQGKNMSNRLPPCFLCGPLLLLAIALRLSWAEGYFSLTEQDRGGAYYGRGHGR